MRALVVTSPSRAEVMELEDPKPGQGELLIRVERVGICGTDVELFKGEMAYIDQGLTTFPIRLGHEWTGTVIEVGKGVNTSWINKRVTGDTMLGCGNCSYCLNGNQHVCPDRLEVGITDGWPGALAELHLIPERFALLIPDGLTLAAAALIEPGGNSLRSVAASEVNSGDRLLIIGAGTIGLLAAQFALARGVEVHIAGARKSSLQLAQDLGIPFIYSLDEISVSEDRFDAVIDASSLVAAPGLAIKLVKPAGRIVLIGISGSPSLVDSREIALKDLTAVGILSASPGLKSAIAIFSAGEVVPDSIVSEVISLEEVPSRLLGARGENAGPGPKVQVDPRIIHQ